VSFADHYCQQQAIPPAAFERTVLQRCLHPTARWLYPLLHVVPGYFTPDLAFIRHVARLHRAEDFRAEEIDFTQDPANDRFHRRHLRLRVSARRLYRLVRTTLPSPPV